MFTVDYEIINRNALSAITNTNRDSLHTTGVCNGNGAPEHNRMFNNTTSSSEGYNYNKTDRVINDNNNTDKNSNHRR